MAAFQQPSGQPQAEGLCLRYPENLGTHRELTLENALTFLLRGHQTAANVPFVWGYIDKPPEGQLFLVHVSNQSAFPIDGIRYQEPESKYTVPAGPNRELEIHEVKFGFVPGIDNTVGAWRQRRRFRLVRGGYPQLWLVHYSHGPNGPIAPALMNAPVRNYPLRPVHERAVFVVGEKTGTMVGGPPSGFNSQQQQLAQQNNNLAMLEQQQQQQRRREQERVARQGRQNRPEDDDSGDENEASITTKALAMTRYRRNHEFMSAVFTQAAFGDKNAPPRPSPYSIFNKSELEAQSERLQAEIQILQAKAAERKAAQDASRATIEVDVAS
ncbi:hypothetical protein C8F01DRAFT_1350409 [Mycena amicta]|nr:hypothetical protein C8F01DRAFT_1350409 [Mycena amicta]